MSTFYAGTEIEALAERLAANLADETRTRDPFQPAWIIVPNRNLKKWLQLRLAQRLGIAINLRFEYLETGLWELLRALDPLSLPSPRRGEGKRGQPELLSHTALQLAILAVLLDERARRPELQPLQSYLGDANAAARQNYCRKAWQLSDQLARHFRDYEYHRQDMVERWAERPRSKRARVTNIAAPMEACQQALWREVFGALRQTSGKRLLTLPQYAREALPRLKGATRPASGTGAGHLQAVHVFGISQISSFHAQLLRDLSAALDLKIYHLNVFAAREAANAQNPANELTALWGAAARESLFMYSSLFYDAGLAFELCPRLKKWEKEEPQSLLSNVQRGILEDRAPAEIVVQDRSLQVLSCPSVYREVETVHNSIIHNMRQNPALKLTDIAVLVTNMAAYRPALQSVFGREPRQVPYNLTDFSAADNSVFGQGLLGLLDLALSPFTRSKVFEALMNPCVLAAAGVERADALVWMRWAEALNIYHTFDRAEKAALGYADNTLYTWQQGLRRLRLGRIMDVAQASRLRAGETPALHAYEGVVPYADLESADDKLLGSFCALVESLQRRLRELCDLKAGGTVWREKIAALIAEFLAVPDDRPEEDLARRNLLEALDSLRLLDELTPPPGPLPQGEGGTRLGIELPLVREFIRDNLSGIESTLGSYLTGGVTISALQPMRPIPFQIVYVMGLGEGLFPGRDAASALDLCAREKRRGDISLPETNQYLFLESLLSTRRKLYLSYVGRDLERFQTLYPCSVMNVLLRHLDQQVDGGKFQTVEIPLHGSSARYLDQQELAPHTDALVNYSAADRLLCLLDPTQAERLKLTAAQRESVLMRERALRPDFRAGAAAPAAGGAVEQISLRELKAFLRNPIEGAVKRHLRLYDDDEEEPPPDDEPFFTADPASRELLLTTLRDFVVQEMKNLTGKGGAAWQAQFARAYEACRLRGATPDGAFADADRAQLQRVLDARVKQLADFVGSRKHIEFHETVLMAPGVADTGGRPALPALEIALDGGQKAQLVGSLPLVWRANEAVEALVIVPGEAAKNKLSPWLLEPFLFYLAARQHGWCAERPFCLHVAGQNGIARFRYQITAETAREYLHALLGDFVKRDAFELLPFVLVAGKSALQRAFTDAEDPALRAGYAEMLRECIEDDLSGGHPLYHPMRWLGLVAAQVPPDAYDKVRRRFRLLAAGIEERR